MCNSGPSSSGEVSPSLRKWLRARKNGGRVVRLYRSSISWKLSLILLLSLIGCESLAAQLSASRGDGVIDVQLAFSDSTRFSGIGTVRVLNEAGAAIFEARVEANGKATIHNLVPGTYQVEVNAPGFATVRETVTLESKWSQASVSLTMKPVESGGADPTKVPIPVLAPAARKEVTKGLDTFQKGNIEESRKHFEKALTMAPGNPDVQFLMGVLELQDKHISAAEEHLLKAIQIYPNHVRSLETLGEVYSSQGQPDKAVPMLEKAASLEDGSWKAHWKLGRAYLQINDPEKARTQAERAITLGKAAAGPAYLLKAEALADLAKWDEAKATLEKFVTEQPSDPYSQKARALEKLIERDEQRAERYLPLPMTVPDGLLEVADLRPQIAPKKNSVWAQPGIDEFVPKVAPNVACSLQQILTGVSNRADELMANLERFSATEQLVHYTVDKAGELRSPQLRSFDYVASISRGRRGVIQLEEYRDGGLTQDKFPAQIATKGLPAMALIFHRQMSGDFQFVCEGLGSVEGRPAWQLHFEQRRDRPSQIRAYVIAGNYHPVALKGRAWIDAGTFQVVRLESELVRPVPEIHLKREHLSIEYAPVRFQTRDLQLWLPQRAQLFVEEDKLAFYRTHEFSKFQLFSVGVDQRIRSPKESYSFTNLSNQEIQGRLIITPVLERSITPISITFTIPPQASVIKTVGSGKDLDISPDWIASARFVYQGAPGAVEGNALLIESSTLEIVPESQLPPGAQN
jgi:tetratricopeptide (TPR) repeat protein